ncbi:MAG: insulinase family protein [Bacteroidetes bacterium]|nr:insulinase family protein [Bacteroidota bacterium]
MKIRLLGLLALGFLITNAFGQTNLDQSTPLPIDPNVKIGKLENGMVYYIRKNAKPEKRVELRLVVNTGSIMETDAQQGLAHFTEHMCFNGTKNFPKNALVDYLQKIGVRFGADINAYTSFDETVYMLQIPTDKEGLLEQGYQVIEDWAHNVTFNGKEIDKERGVITEEWRLGLGAQDRMMKKFLPIIFKDSKYANRIPIGKIDIIKSFKHDTLRKFYYDWYRPDLQAVIVIGDINVDSAEAKIIKHFAAIKKRKNPKPRTMFDVPNNVEPLIAIETDKEAINNSLMLFYKHPQEVKKTIGDYRTYLIEQLYTGMLNARFSEIALKTDAPFIYAASSYDSFWARNVNVFACEAMPKENQIDKSLETILIENERIKQFGFLESEFDRQKKEVLSNMEKASKEADKTESADFCSEYTKNYLTQEPIPGIKAEYEYTVNLLPEIKLSEINLLAKKWITDENIGLVVTAPEKEGVKVPTNDDVLKIIKDSKTAQIEQYVDKYKSEHLVGKELNGSKVISKVENKEVGFTELTLSNGIKVVLKPTDFKNDEILVSAYSPGGSSLYNDSVFFASNYSSEIIDQSGIGDFDNVELEKTLKGKTVQISPSISDVKESLLGSASPKDLETLLQLTYLYFDSPRKDSAAFNTFISKMKNQVKFIFASPIFSFYDTLFKTAYPNYPRLIIIPKTEQIDKIKHDSVYRIYKDRFADASDFKFFFVGNFSVDSITPLIEKYIGSLPVTNRNETWRDISPKFADGVNELTLYKGSDPQSMVGILMQGPLEWNEKNNLSISLLEGIFEIKLIEVIREKLSGVYSPQASITLDHYPKSEYTVMVMFGCSPKKANKLTKAIFEIMKNIQINGPTQIDIDKAKEAIIRERETNSRENEFWLNTIEAAYFNNDDVNQITKFEEQVKAITIDDIKLLAQKCFTKEHYVRAVLLPVKKK